MNTLSVVTDPLGAKFKWDNVAPVSTRNPTTRPTPHILYVPVDLGVLHKLYVSTCVVPSNSVEMLDSSHCDYLSLHNYSPTWLERPFPLPVS